MMSEVGSPFSWSLATWLYFFQWVSVSTLAITVLLGIVVNRRQSEKILSLQKGIIDAQFDLEKERRLRLDVEEIVAWRRIGWLTSERRDSLKRFAGTEVEILVVDEFEARRLAREISWVLGNCDWKVLSVETLGDIDELKTPIGVDVAITPTGLSSPSMPQAEALKDLLLENHIAARIKGVGWNVGRPVHNKEMLIGTNPLPSGRIRLMIGLRPDLNWYFGTGQYRTAQTADEIRRGEPPASLPARKPE
jgi:hypothetical protein